MRGTVSGRDLSCPPPFLANRGPRGGSQRPRPAQITAWVARAYNITWPELIGIRHHAHLVEARALATWAMRTLVTPPMSYPEIGRALGGRDHNTTINLHEKAIILRLRSARFKGACVDITRAFESREKLHARH